MLVEGVDGLEAPASSANGDATQPRLRLEILVARLVDTCSHLLVSTPTEAHGARLELFVPLLKRLVKPWLRRRSRPTLWTRSYWA